MLGCLGGRKVGFLVEMSDTWEAMGILLSLFDHQTNGKENETMERSERWNGNECEILKERECPYCLSKVKQGMLVSSSNNKDRVIITRFLCFDCYASRKDGEDREARKDDELSEKLDKAYAGLKSGKISDLEGGTLFVYNDFDWIRASKSIIAIQAVRVKDGLVVTFNHDDKFDKVVWMPSDQNHPFRRPGMFDDQTNAHCGEPEKTGPWPSDILDGLIFSPALKKAMEIVGSKEPGSKSFSTAERFDILTASIDALEESVSDLEESRDTLELTTVPKDLYPNLEIPQGTSLINNDVLGEILKISRNFDRRIKDLEAVTLDDRQQSQKRKTAVDESHRLLEESGDELRGGLVDALKAIETISVALLNADKEDLVGGVRAVVRDFLLRRFTVLGEL